MNRFKHILSVLFITAFAVSASHAQTNLSMQNVSVINEQGHVRLSWKYAGTEDLVIFRDSLAISSLSPIDTIYDPSITSYIDKSAQANIFPRLYKIQSATTPNETYTQIISTYKLTYDYDSCEAVINLHWTEQQHNDLPSNQWNPSGFIIYQYKDGILQQTNINNSQSSYTIDNIEENTNYTFKIGVEWEESDSTGFSNPVGKFTEMPQSPDYIDAIYATVEGENTHLKFEIAPNSELSTYKLLYSSSATGSYDTLKTITTTDFEIITTHENSNPDTEITYYKLVAINNCGNITTQSDIINNILLTIEREENIHSLSWNYFKEFDLPNANYELYRSKDNSGPQLIRSFSNHNFFDDEITTVGQDIETGLYCYFIQATEMGSTEYSQSNTVCIYIEPDIFIPEAITPNGDGNNDELKIQPDLSLFPGDYQLTIYNRWSNVIFQTKNPGKNWNGTDTNGKAVPTGAYIYYLKIKLPDGQIIEKRGHITVFYP
ncbi:MAG: gliding motility-associated C-terminal domain-containing protein [Bacteroidota bacterium]|nr:gliding motility-associated C-terminal domain-containing protein [Bacteroidota bacterium]